MKVDGIPEDISINANLSFKNRCQRRNSFYTKTKKYVLKIMNKAIL